jgi:hypothetical protein
VPAPAPPAQPEARLGQVSALSRHGPGIAAPGGMGIWSDMRGITRLPVAYVSCLEEREAAARLSLSVSLIITAVKGANGNHPMRLIRVFGALLSCALIVSCGFRALTQQDGAVAEAWPAGYASEASH